MSEIESGEQELAAFKENFDSGLDEILELLEMMPEQPLPADPSSMGFDERTFEELSIAEKEAVYEVIYQKFGLDPKNLSENGLREYSTKSESGQIKVSVYKTNRDDIFLQELHFVDVEKRWLIGPNQDI